MTLDVLNLMLVLMAALAGGWIAARFGYPAILGELGAGILLGPPLLGLLQADDALVVIGKLGVVLLMLYIGLHLDPTDIGRASKAGALAAAGGFLVPAALGFGLMMLVNGDPIASTFVAVAMGVTSLATKSRILVDLGILNTRIAHVLMAGALFSDIAALIIFATVLGLAATGAIAIGGVLAASAKAIVFLGVTWFVGTKVFPVLGRWISKRSVDSTVLFLLVVIAGLGFAAAADAAGLHAILGAFLAGLYIREGVLPHRQMADVERRMRGVSLGLLAPVFFVTAGYNVSFGVFTEAPLLLIAVVVLATVGKIVGTAIFYIPTGYGIREGIAVGAGMNGRGAVEIIVAEIALVAGLIDETVFSILVFMAIFTTATVPILLTASIKWLRRHDQLVADDRDGIVIVGAGPLARTVALQLGGASHVTLVDVNAAHCRDARELGLNAILGSGVDTDILHEAGADSSKALLAITPNAEVNLLSAKLGAQRFGIPRPLAALPHDAPDSLAAMLEDFDGDLLFGRRVDVGSWDVSIEAGETAEVSYTLAEPIEVIERGSSVDPLAASLESLPIALLSSSGIEPYSEGLDLASAEQIVGIGRVGTRFMSEREGRLATG